MNRRPDPRRFHVVRFAAWEALAPLAEEWDRLAGGNPFRSWTWLSCWWRHYGRGRDLYVLGAFAPSGELVGLAPWFAEPSPTRGRVVRFLGTGEVCSEYLSLLCEPGCEVETAAAMAEWLIAATQADPLPQAHSDRWDLLELTAVDAADGPIALLAEQLRLGGAAVHCRPGPDCWRFTLPATWDEFYAAGSKTFRRRLRRIETPFENGRATVRSVASREELPQFQRLLVELHQRRRRQVGQPGSFAAPQFEAFHREVMRGLYDAGQLLLTCVELDGQPAAVDYALLGGGRLYAYQAGVDPDRLDDSPGHLGNCVLLREAIARGCRTFDFLRGDEPYKRLWGARPHPTTELRIVPDRLGARLRLGLWRAGSGLKRWARRLGAPVENNPAGPLPRSPG